jgi:hypothetical protein
MESGHYELIIPYRSDEEWDKTVYGLLAGRMRNCFIEAVTWEEGTERR